jgi:hypothetical protein
VACPESNYQPKAQIKKPDVDAQKLKIVGMIDLNQYDRKDFAPHFATISDLLESSAKSALEDHKHNQITCYLL